MPIEVAKSAAAPGTADDLWSGDLFYWPPGHTVRVQHDAESLMFSPERAHGDVLAHMKAKLDG